MAETKLKASRSAGYSGPVGKWVGGVAQQTLDDLQRLEDVVALSRGGVRLSLHMPEVVRVIKMAEPHFGTVSDSQEEHKQRVENAAKRAELGKREQESDYAVLNSMAVVAICAHLEFFVKNVAEGFLRHHRGIWKVPALQRLSIRLGDYFGTSSARRHTLIVELLERDLMTESRYGVDRFERMLDVFGFAGPTSRSVKKVLYELFSVRNLIAHNAGRVDRKFKIECPWIKSKVGQPHHVSSASLAIYLRGVSTYITIIICRWGRRRGGDMSESEQFCEEQGLAIGKMHALEAKRPRGQRPASKPDARIDESGPESS